MRGGKVLTCRQVGNLPPHNRGWSPFTVKTPIVDGDLTSNLRFWRPPVRIFPFVDGAVVALAGLPGCVAASFQLAGKLENCRHIIAAKSNLHRENTDC